MEGAGLREDYHSGVPLMTFQGTGTDESDFMQSDEEEDPLEGVLTRMKYRPQASQPHDFWPSIILSGGLCLVLGFVLSYVAFVVGQKSLSSSDMIVRNLDQSLASFASQYASEDHILSFINDLQHVGTEKEVSRIWDHFSHMGFDDLQLFNYSTVGAQQNPLHVSKVSLLRPNGQVHLSSEVNISTSLPNAPLIDVTGTLIYVNYGLSDDWLSLEAGNISVAHQVVIARTGRLLPENIAEAAYRRGAAALLLFHEKDDVEHYPFWFPHSVTPSAGGVFDQNQGFQLPVAVMENTAAKNLLRVTMLHIDSPSSFDVSRPSVGRGTVNLQGYSLPHFSLTQDIVTIFGGWEEPDRYVVIGAHRMRGRNATGALMELARLFKKLKEDKGWRPRCSLILASWGGEGTVGAAAWVAQFQKSLNSRAVGYIDIHELEPIWSGGGAPLVSTTPLLQQVLSQALSVVPALKILVPKPSELPLPGGRGGCHPFVHQAAISCLQFHFTNISTLTMEVQAASVVALYLLESSLLPMDVRHLASSIQDSIKDFHTRYDQMLKQHNITLAPLDIAVSQFVQTAQRFHDHIDKHNFHSGLQLREVNEQFTQVASTFVTPHLHKNRDEFLWPSSIYPDGVSGGFGPLLDALDACHLDTVREEHGEELKSKIQHLVIALQAASTLLLPPTQLH